MVVERGIPWGYHGMGRWARRTHSRQPSQPYIHICICVYVYTYTYAHALSRIPSLVWCFLGLRHAAKHKNTAMLQTPNISKILKLNLTKHCNAPKFQRNHSPGIYGYKRASGFRILEFLSSTVFGEVKATKHCNARKLFLKPNLTRHKTSKILYRC